MTHSALETQGQRFLSLILQQALSDSWLTPEDFAAAFSPQVVMEALEKAPELRARILVQAAGVHERIAPKKSTTAAAEDLNIALSEGVCTPAVLVELFGMDDRVRYSSNDDLWTLLTRDTFWTQQSERARTRMHAVVTAGLDQGLIQLGDVVDAVTPARLSSDLPKPLLERALTRAIERGRAGVAFDAEGLFDVLPLEDWVNHVPLAVLWDALVLERVLPAAGVVPIAPRGRPAPAGSATGGGSPVDDVKPLHPAGESEARERAVANLKRLDRLPPRVDSLLSPTLLAIDGMYAELLSTSDEEERAQAIRDAFPNAAMLEEALFAVAEALDPRLNADTLRARGAEGESLITLVLFEERRRSSGRSSIPPGSSPSRPPGPVTSPTPPAVVEAHAPPPPLPAATQTSKRPSVPPPLPPGGKRSLPPPPLPAKGVGGRAR